MKRYLLLALVLCALPALAQVFDNQAVDDTTVTPWNYCYQGGSGVHSCSPGGSGSVSSPVQTINNASPSLDGASISCGFTGTAFADFLCYYQGGAHNTAIRFHADYQIEITGSGLNDAEFDTYQYIHASLDEFMFGSQCHIGGKWQIWDSLHGAWHDTSVTCTLPLNTFHHIVWDVHRIAGETACQGHPCMYYDTLTVDGTAYAINTTYPAGILPGSFSDQTGLNFQLDTNGSGGMLTEYIDEASLTGYDTLNPLPTLFNAGFNQGSSPWCPKDGNNVAAQIYGYRIWDDGQKWGQIQTSNTAPTFTGLDNHINTRAGGNNTQAGENIAIGAPCPGTPMAFIYTFGDTPQWASAGAIAANNCASPNTQYSCTAPASLHGDGTGTDVEYSTFAADVITRYKTFAGTRYYEIWNEADSSNFWCWNDNTACGGSGSANNPALHANVPSLNNLVLMGWNLKKIAACVDPGAKILSPSFHVGTALTWFHNYNITTITAPAMNPGVNGYPLGCPVIASQSVTGKQTYDYVNVHARGTQVAYPNVAGNWNPAATITAITNTQTEIANDSLPNPTVIFDDEDGYNSTTEGGGNTDGYSAYVAQKEAFVASLGVTQLYWYQWDTATIGLNSTLQGTAWDTMAGWLTGATITSPLTLVGNLYEMGLTKGGITELIVWDTSKYSQPCCVAPANQTFSALYTKATDLTGTVTSLSSGVASVGWKPILLQQISVGTGGDNIYCPSTGIPTWPATDGPANLPTACYNTATANTPAPGAVVNVTTAGQLTTALAAAACGQQITLQAGNVFSGNFTVPAVHCAANNYLWITTSGLASLPSEGVRTSPCYSGVTSLPNRPAYACPGTPGTYTAQIITPNTSPALTFTTGTSGVRVMGLEITRANGTGLVGALIGLGNIGNIDHIIFDRNWMHGNEQQDETNLAFSNSATSYVAATDNYGNNFYCISSTGHCTDSHMFFGGVNITNSVTENVLKYVNNFDESAGENMLHGGGGTNTTPNNLEIRLNTFFKNPCWNPSAGCYDGGVGGHAYVVKNLFELKNASKVLLEGNTFQNNWGGFSQGGECWAITPVNQSGLSPTAVVTDFTARYNTCNSINFFAELDMASNGGFIAAGHNHYSIHDNVADNMGYCQPTCPTSNPIVQMTTNVGITSAAQTQHDVSVNHNTWVYVPAATPNSVLGLTNPTIASGMNQYNETFTNNVVQTYGGTLNLIGGSQPLNCANGIGVGLPMINACWTNYVFTGNCFVNNGSHTWPGGNTTSVANYTAVFNNYNSGNGGDYTIAAGACKGAANDGSDPGANLTTLASVLAGNPAPGTSSGILTVSITGSGSVTSSPAGIACTPICSASFTNGTPIVLTETPAIGNTFVGWGGVCGGSGGCGLTMGSSPVSVTATFAPVATNSVTVTITPTGGGTITSAPAGISCPGTCTANFTNGTPITLSETPNGGFTFVTWSGICSGATCSFTMGSSPVAATAAFLGPPPPPTAPAVIITQGGIILPGSAIVNH